MLIVNILHSLNAIFLVFTNLTKKYNGSTGFLKISPIVKPIFFMIEFLFQLPWDEKCLFFFLLLIQKLPREGCHLVAATSLNLSSIRWSVYMTETISTDGATVCVCSCYFIYQTLHRQSTT